MGRSQYWTRLLQRKVKGSDSNSPRINEAESGHWFKNIMQEKLAVSGDGFGMSSDDHVFLVSGRHPLAIRMCPPPKKNKYS